MSGLLAEISEFGGYLLALGVALVLASVVMGIRKKRGRAAMRVTAREHLERYKQKAAVRDDLQGVMVEVEQLAKRLGAQLDAKTIAIEKLLNEAEVKIRQLEAASAAAGPGDRRQESGGRGQGSGVRRPESEAEGSSRAADLPQDELTRSIYALADEGASADQIARKLDEHVGKVELILALRQSF